ncbi:ArnT family glycosyltransferase [Neisseria sp. Ec49-e6-T10]|uniref:ArnT family glycosyltransferase n=1 Tax=Neisseria sp. Ec49-e6-T10 TaxID=3140744 RepID=UPI003EB6A8E7
MLIYTPPKNQDLPKPTEKPWLLLLLCCVWLWPAIFGHDPWKPYEPYIYQSVLEMLETHRGIAPQVHGTWYVSTPPLYAWVGAFFHELFSPWLLSGYDAVRLATPLFMSIGLAFAGGAGRHLLGRRNGRSVVLILIGCSGLMVVGHQMDNMAATFMGYAMAMYAISLSPKKPGLAGALLGGSLVVILLSSNLLELSFVILLTLVLPSFSHWRNRQYLICLVFAFTLAIPLGLVWPLSLRAELPQVFDLWWQTFAWSGVSKLNQAVFLNDLGYYPTVVLWFTFPAWPLALWSLYKRQSVSLPALQLSVVWFVLSLILLTLLSQHSSEYAVVLLLPLAVLGAAQLDSLRRGAAAFLNWFGVMTFGALALFLWIGFIAMNWGWPTKLAERSLYFSPFYTPTISFFAVIIAVLVTPVWLWSVTRKHLRGRQAVTNWAAGMTMAWVLIFTLWLPWLNQAKSFRPVVLQMEASLSPKLKNNLMAGNVCMQADSTNLQLVTAWREYGSLPLKLNRTHCRYKIVVGAEEMQIEHGWQVMWQGARPRDKNNTYRLLKRII